MSRGWFFWRQASQGARAKRPFPPRPARRRGRLVVELLEDRRLLAAVVPLDASTLTQLSIDPLGYRSSSLLVQFRTDLSPTALATAAVAGTTLDDPWALTPGLRRVELDPGTDLQAALQAYKDNPNVLYAEPDYRVALQLTPDDPWFDSQQWDMNNVGQTGGTGDADIDAPEAWDVTTGSDDVVVAVIDTGVDYTHPDLAANIWTNPGEVPGNRIDDDGNGFIDDIHGYDFVNRDGDPMDDHFHGTHVAGTIGAVGNDGSGIAGINWHVKIMALKFLDASGGGFTSDAIAALNYAVANGATVSNNSWGGGGFSNAFQDALIKATQPTAKNPYGHIFVAAAGNDSNNNDVSPSYPASYGVGNVVAVAATDHNDELAWFSNYGKNSVHLGAPGVNIYSTLPVQQTPAMIDEGLPANYGILSGTSMATPHVTGVVALVRALHPDWTYGEIIDQVLGTVDVVPDLTQTATGGRLNAAGAVGNPPLDTTGPRVVASDPAGLVTGTISSVRLRFSEPLDPATIDASDVVSLDGPEGPIAVTGVIPVAGTNNRQFDVTFDPPQSAEGAYTLVIGPDISDRVGNLMDQDKDGAFGENPDDQYTANFSIVGTLLYSSDDVPAPIRRFSAVGSYLTINDDVTIADLNVQLTISHPYVGNLMIYLISPSGSTAFLTLFDGGVGPGFVNTTFDDEASTFISDGSAPFTGTYKPHDPLDPLFEFFGIYETDNPLSIFDGESTAGRWELWVENWSFGGDRGTLDAWSLEISPGGGSPPPPDTGNQPPFAGSDFFQTDDLTPLVLLPDDLLANDFDPDGDPLSLVDVGGAAGGSVLLDPDGTVTFTPDIGFVGTASFQYVISDGKDTAVGNVSIDVKDFFEWHNRDVALDVNNDGSVSSIDALIVFNLLNSRGPGSLEFVLGEGVPTLFYDVAPDNYVTSLDALVVINYLNNLPAQPTSLSASATQAAPSAVAAGLLQTNVATPGAANSPAATGVSDYPAAVDSILAAAAGDDLLKELRRWRANRAPGAGLCR